MLVRSIDPSERLRWTSSNARSTAAVAPVSRRKSPTLSWSSRCRSGLANGSAGSMAVTTFCRAASTVSWEAMSASVNHEGQGPTSTDSGTCRVISPGSATYDGTRVRPSSATRPR